LWGLGTPEAGEEKKIPYPNPGWLETRHPDRPAFIDTHDGHKELVRFFSLNDPLVKEVVRRGFESLHRDKYDDYPFLGDVFNEHIKHAREALADSYHKGKIKGPSLTNTLHIAFLSLSATFSPYFTRDEKDKIFGVQMPGENDGDELKSFYHSATNIPTVFPIYEAECSKGEDKLFRCVGIDKMVHFAQFAYLTHQFLYAYQHNLQDFQRMPRAAWMYASRGIKEDVWSTYS